MSLNLILILHVVFEQCRLSKLVMVAQDKLKSFIVSFVVACRVNVTDQFQTHSLPNDACFINVVIYTLGSVKPYVNIVCAD